MYFYKKKSIVLRTVFRQVKEEKSKSLDTYLYFSKYTQISALMYFMSLFFCKTNF